jgi:3-isopropylmalate/(R)-2-methylmalate dehydratase small subunit
MSDSLIRTGRVWKFGNDINTDLIFPAAMFRAPVSEQHLQCFESIRPGWVKSVKVGDVIVAGENFGTGSGRPVGAVLVACGVRGLLADSLNGLCLRSCINGGLPVIGLPGIAAAFEDGETARVDFSKGVIENLNQGSRIQATPLEPLWESILVAGGVTEMLIEEGCIEREPFIARST